MSIMLKPHVVRFSPGYEGRSSGASAQHQDVVQLGTAAPVGGMGAESLCCQSCGDALHDDLALIHRGRNLRGDTFEKVYHARHVLGGRDAPELAGGDPHGVPS